MQGLDIGACLILQGDYLPVNVLMRFVYVCDETFFSLWNFLGVVHSGLFSCSRALDVSYSSTMCNSVSLPAKTQRGPTKVVHPERPKFIGTLRGVGGRGVGDYTSSNRPY